MTVMRTSLGVAVLGCAAAIVCSAAVASADPPDPHQPDLPKNFCPGGQWGLGRLRVCDGEKYPDGSYWHQWMGATAGSGRHGTTTASATAATTPSRHRHRPVAATGQFRLNRPHRPPRPQPNRAAVPRSTAPLLATAGRCRYGCGRLRHQTAKGSWRWRGLDALHNYQCCRPWGAPVYRAPV